MAFTIKEDGVRVDVKANRRLAIKAVNERGLDLLTGCSPRRIEAVDYKGDIIGALYYDGWNLNRIK